MKIKILQVASYNGNIGDIANHNGFRYSMENSGIKAEYTNLEIRNFYQARGGVFGKEFIDLANAHDLVIFGGGGFFRLKWEYSQTGTTLDLSKEVLEAIKKPILFNCIGASIEKECNEFIVDRFRKFLDIICRNPHYLVSVRNDGSYELLNKLYNNEYRSGLLRVPDGGFFTKCENWYDICEVDKNFINIAINLAGDMPEVRFEGGEIYRDVENFIIEFSETCNKLLYDHPNYRLVFIPHIYSDLEIIYKVISKLNDVFIRTRIVCTGLYNGAATDGLKAFYVYKNCDLVLGMRYHSNVVPIGMNIPTIMLGTYEPHIKLYDDLGIPDRCLHVNLRRSFSTDLTGAIEDAIRNREKYVDENQLINEKLKNDNDIYMKKIVNWLKSSL